MQVKNITARVSFQPKLMAEGLLRVPCAFDHLDDDGEKSGVAFHDVTLRGDTVSAALAALAVGDLLELDIRVITKKVQKEDGSNAYYTNFYADRMIILQKAQRASTFVDAAPVAEAAPAKKPSKKRKSA